MSRKLLLSAALAGLLLPALFAVSSVPAAAQTGPTPTPAAAATPAPVRPPVLNLPEPSAGGDGQSLRLPFTQLGVRNDLILRGVNPGSGVFFPIPEDWTLISARLEVRLSHSTTLSPDSALTVSVNGQPAASLRLSPENSSSALWTVTLPEGQIKGENLDIRLDGYLRTTDNACHDMEDATNWATISRDSALVVQSQRAPFQPNLARFPYPVLRARALQDAAALVVIPDDASSEDWPSVLPLAGFLGQTAGFRPFNLYAVRERDLTPALAAAYDLVFAGRAGQLKLLQQNASTFPLKLANGKIAGSDGRALADDTGAVMEGVSPWSKERGILVLSGNGAEGLRRAVQAVIQPGFANLARGTFALVPELPRVEGSNVAAAPSVWSLQTLGLGDQVVRGIGLQTVDVGLDLPVARTASGAQLVAYVSHSPFTTGDRSFFNVNVNDVPVKGVYLSADNEQRGRLEISLPGSALRPGRNSLRFQFELHLARSEDCARSGGDQAWGILHRDSALTIDFGANRSGGSLENLPAPFTESTLLVLPASPGANELAAAFLIANQFGRELGERVSAITAVAVDRLDRGQLRAAHVILLGQPSDQPLLTEALAVGPIGLDGNGRFLRTSRTNLRLQSDQPLGMLVLQTSPWASNKSTLAISGTSDEAAGWAALLLSDSGRRNQIRGDLAVIDGAGTLTTLDSRAQPSGVTGQSEGTRPTPEWTRWAAIAILLLVVLGVAGLLGRRLWQRRSLQPTPPT